LKFHGVRDKIFKNLWDTIKERLVNSDLDKEVVRQEIEILDRQYQLELLVDKPYGICFCNNSDIMQQWNEYGDKTRGVVLGFDLSWFKDLKYQMPHPSSNFLNSIGYNEVLYHDKSLEDGFYKICYDAINRYGLSAWVMEIRGTFKHYSAFIKNPFFFGEYETRIVFYPNSFQCKDENELAISGLVEHPFPHYCLPWTKKNGDNALKTIGLGCNCSLSQDDLYSILTISGLSGEFMIHKSMGSYKIK
jgi:hypothetical protein